MPTLPPFRTSPSTIARYFFQDCERFFRFTSAGQEQRAKEKIPERQFDHSPLMKAILESGYDWEEAVLRDYLGSQVHVAPGTGRPSTRRFDWDATVKLLRKAKPGTYLYQPTFRVPQAFYDRFGLDAKVLTISDNHPDLIAVLANGAGQRSLRVLDVKRGNSLRLTHRVQILLYALELESILAEVGIGDATVDLDQGAVWLGGEPEPTLFDLGDFRPHLEAFLRQDVPRIMALDASAVNWHFYFRCEWCEYFDHCREEVQRDDNISRLAGLTSYGKQHLTEVAKVQSLADLTKFLKRKDADDVLGQCASLTGQRPYLETQLAAYREKKPQLLGAASPALPKGENLALYLTLQQEPLGQKVYLAGVLLRGKDEIRQEAFSKKLLERLQDSGGKPRPCVLVASNPDEIDAIRRNWIDLLYQILTELDHYNHEQPEWQDKLSLQAYVHNEQEKSLLVAWLIDSLREPKLAEQAMSLLFHFQAPELIIADRHPSQEVAYPIVVLLNALGRLMALPVDVSYTLPESLQSLGSTFNYRRNDYYHFPLGHGLRAEAIHGVWYRGKTNLDDIEKQASFHLYAVSSLAQAIRKQAAEHLFAWPPKFELSAADSLPDPLLSRLAFFARYESLLRCLNLRDIRCEPRAVQTLLGQALELRARDDSVLDVVGQATMELEESTFPSWLLVEDTDAGRQAQLQYRDYLCRKGPWQGKASPHLAVVGIQNLEEDSTGFPTQITVHYHKPFDGSTPRAGRRYLLYPRFTDYITDRVIGFLKARVSKEGLFLALLRDPKNAARRLPLPKAAEAAAASREKKLGLTDSQLSAYREIRQAKVTAIWGPPGTGKTHFLATTILGLAAAHAKAGRPFRILVTAFTHAAIENVLRKIDELRTATLPKGTGLTVGKAKAWQGTQLAHAEVVAEKELGSWASAREQVVLGATVYACEKDAENLMDLFDLVVIDEASQVRVPESAIPITMLAKGGRLVMAGDHKQLPPIVTGTYPEIPPDDPVLHRSIFEAVLPDEERAGLPPKQLVENFRMNDVLTSFAAKLLYGPDYKCWSPEVAARRLNLRMPRDADDLVKACLDPAYPLVMVILQGVRAAKENLLEAKLVAKLTALLRNRLNGRDGKPYPNDADFFREGLFIVSPHRVQIQAIQRELADLRTWKHLPFVDTVEKMQGQEADAVLVSYGVSDPEFAMQEAEFIYSLNRLNVAITRARAKCVVFLPEPLLDATPYVLDQPEAAKGLAYMRRLAAAIETSGEELSFDLGDSAIARVLRTAKCLKP